MFGNATICAQEKFIGKRLILQHLNVAQAPTIVSYTERTATAIEGEVAMMRGMGVTLMYIGGGRLIKYHPFTGATLVNVSISPLTSSTYNMHGTRVRSSKPWRW